jgi:hypothetical protein
LHGPKAHGHGVTALLTIVREGNNPKLSAHKFAFTPPPPLPVDTDTLYPQLNQLLVAALTQSISLQSLASNLALGHI